MQSVAWQVQIVYSRSLIRMSKDVFDSLHGIWADFAGICILIEPLQAAMSQGLDHGLLYRVSAHGSSLDARLSGAAVEAAVVEEFHDLIVVARLDHGDGGIVVDYLAEVEDGV